MSRFWSFPHPVNESATRLVAGMTAILALLVITTEQRWLLVFLTYEFLARVAAGPRISPTARLAHHLLLPVLKLPVRPAPGPPKRFAQFIGLMFSAGACLCWFVLHRLDIAKVLLGVLTLFATLEAVLGFCAGCFLFNQLMKLGLIPREACAQCVDWRVPGK